MSLAQDIELAKGVYAVGTPICPGGYDLKSEKLPGSQVSPRGPFMPQ